MIKAAGKSYISDAMLKVKQVSRFEFGDCFKREVDIWQDAFGRQVIYEKERFPCFDSFDYLHENRYFHWYFIRHAGGVTMVYLQDDRPDAKVTEDITRENARAQGMRSAHIDLLEKAGFWCE